MESNVKEDIKTQNKNLTQTRGTSFFSFVCSVEAKSRGRTKFKDSPEPGNTCATLSLVVI
jgi:hypothetical protein